MIVYRCDRCKKDSTADRFLARIELKVDRHSEPKAVGEFCNDCRGVMIRGFNQLCNADSYVAGLEKAEPNEV